MTVTAVRLTHRPDAASRAPSGDVPSGAPGAADASTSEALVDSFGRVHRDLRISLTDRCSLRCTYCMPEQGNEWLARSSILTTPEILRVARACASAGVSTFRLTGGEPLLRPDVVDIVRGLAALRTPDGTAVDVAMTTNGIRLPQLVAPLAEAGLSRVNISLDTLDARRFYELTRRDRLADVLEGIAAATGAGLHPVKINTVAMRGVNDGELTDLVDFALAQGAELRFIEQMPLDAGHTWDRTRMVTGAEILAALRTRWTVTPIPGRGGAPAERFRLRGPGTGPEAVVGVIASVTAPFCGACDRIRLTADGQLRSCLFSTSETDLMGVLRGEPGVGASGRGPLAGDVGDDDAVLAQVRTCLAGKRAGHGIDDPSFLQPRRGMNAIGG